MEDLLARERAAEHDVLKMLKEQDAPMQAVLDAFKSYRQLTETVAFSDFSRAEGSELRLWQAHVLGRKYFAKFWKPAQKQRAEFPVEARQIQRFFLSWLKHSERYYRNYITELNLASNGVVLQRIASQVETKGDKATGESHGTSISSELYQYASDSCHRTLGYLGDICRYRAEDKLDDTPNFGPAIGFYALAATFRPSSGLGHHQQAVIALQNKHHLRAIYHLYRAITVEDPFPLAINNLQKEVEKTNAAWVKNTLIQKGPPNDPDASKNHLVGWFVRLHSMCYSGEEFSGHNELELEVLSRLTNVIKQRDLDGTLMRMIIINVAAQYTAGERFKNASDNMLFQQSYLYYFRFNLRTFTALLRVFYDDLRSKLSNMDDANDDDLTVKLTRISRSLLPCLRICNNWLATVVHIVCGLATEESMAGSITQFWSSYARVVDLMAQAFPIWDLDDVANIGYMLVEDVDTIAFKPLMDDGGKTSKTWYDRTTGDLRPRCTDTDVVQASADVEMLQRVKDFLADGVEMASSDDGAPVFIRGTRIYHGSEQDIEPLVVQPMEYAPEPIAPPKSRSIQAQAAPKSKPKPISYASIAANGHAQQARPAQPLPKKAKTAKVQSRDDDLSRMVDDLVDDDEGNHPVTPPQQLACDPAVVSNGDGLAIMQDSLTDLNSSAPKYPHPPARSPISFISRPTAALTPPGIRPTAYSTTGSMSPHHERMQSISRIWGSAPGSTSPAFPPGLPTGTLGASPAIGHPRIHSRVNSASSIRSRNSMAGNDSWGTLESAPRVIAEHAAVKTPYANGYSSVEQHGIANSMLFGAGGGLWSPAWEGTNRQASPPNGQGG
ncbi:unnamed protein product [Zymoseptoria tritici ST99CH_3D7]|uniref:DNA/RNA-binding domain-containing protein n=1 Tax=Zymoseptoria tritici (strain ST99CH_3D7) TaxID=1276538 RepID=A0A1X7RKE8_ZYMT9|nr:unnamed protein product [Zymoseptoria tritici ST99CH_3D7]